MQQIIVIGDVNMTSVDAFVYYKEQCFFCRDDLRYKELVL